MVGEKGARRLRMRIEKEFWWLGSDGGDVYNTGCCQIG